MTESRVATVALPFRCRHEPNLVFVNVQEPARQCIRMLFVAFWVILGAFVQPLPCDFERVSTFMVSGSIAPQCAHDKFLGQRTPTITMRRDLPGPVQPQQLILVGTPVLQRDLGFCRLSKGLNPCGDSMEDVQFLCISQLLNQ